MNGSIVPFDVVRMLLGDTPGTFVVEVILRISVLYAVLVVATRLMGRRLAAGLSRNELSALVSLAAAIGPAVQDPQRGLLPPMIVAGLVVLFQRRVARATTQSRRAETLLQGNIVTLLSEGRIDLKLAKRNGISRERLMAQIRTRGLEHLGKLERLYLEPDGSFSAVAHRGGRPGLTSIPEWDEDMLREQETVDASVCRSCGALFEKPPPACPFCGSKDWTRAVK
jgi:uncharacterized membrane protein YcaP (DUF421 family)